MPIGATSAPDVTHKPDLADLQWILECAERTPAGLSFYPPDDLVMRESAEMLAPQPGYLVVDLHGTTDRAKVGPHWLDADELATVLEGCDEWDGRPIFLMCCDSGRQPDGFAQQLADRLQTDVTAPNRLAWSDFEFNGRAQPYSSDGYLDSFGLPRPVKPPTGKFVTFMPRDVTGHGPGTAREKEITATQPDKDRSGKDRSDKNHSGKDRRPRPAPPRQTSPQLSGHASPAMKRPPARQSSDRGRATGR